MSDVMGKYVEKVQGEVLASAVENREAEIEVQKTEGQVVEQVRKNAETASSVLAKLLAKVEDVQGQDATIAAVRAVADAQNKSVDALLKMTGRDHKAQEDDLAGVLTNMAAKGFIRVNVSLDAGGGDGE